MTTYCRQSLTTCSATDELKERPATDHVACRAQRTPAGSRNTTMNPPSNGPWQFVVADWVVPKADRNEIGIFDLERFSGAGRVNEDVEVPRWWRMPPSSCNELFLSVAVSRVDQQRLGFNTRRVSSAALSCQSAAHSLNPHSL